MPAKNTSIILGDHFKSYVSKKVRSGRYSNTSEVIREGLRRMEEEDIKLQTLRDKLAIGAKQAKEGKYSTNFSYEALMQELDEEFTKENN